MTSVFLLETGCASTRPWCLCGACVYTWLLRLHVCGVGCLFSRRLVVYLQGERLLSAAAPSSISGCLVFRRLVVYMQGERLLSAIAPSSSSVSFRIVWFSCRVSGCYQQPPLPQVLLVSVYCGFVFSVLCVCSMCVSPLVRRALSACATQPKKKKKLQTRCRRVSVCCPCCSL